LSTFTERITFNKTTNEIDRTLPMLLADNGKMSLQVWNKFCDTIDESTKPLRRVECAQKFTFPVLAVLIVCIPLSVLRWHWYFPFTAAPGIPLLFIVSCCVPGYTKGKVTAKISKACAMASNHDKDLTMTVKTTIVEHWYIEVALRNIVDVEAPVAVATAVPVAAAAIPVAAVAAAPASPGPAPKKYINDEESGTMLLNPDYKAWKNSN